jgi:hypothetical protein
MLSLEALFCPVDDVCRIFEPQWQQQAYDRATDRAASA